jgi:hypothetical protein
VTEREREADKHPHLDCMKTERDAITGKPENEKRGVTA